MIEALKDLAGILKEIPNHAMWILGGYLFYKVFIVGSVYGVIKFTVDKIYQAYVAPRTIITKYDIHKGFIDEEVKTAFENLIEKVRSRREKSGFSSQYIHLSDINWLKDAANKELEDQEKRRIERLNLNK